MKKLVKQKKTHYIFSQRGMSLVQVMVAAGLVGMLALAVTQIMDNVSNTQRHANFGSEKFNLESSIRMILAVEKHCRVSLAGNGGVGNLKDPVRFKKSEIDGPEKGLDISLWYANQRGDERSKKKFNGANNKESRDLSKYGSILIKSMKLVMNNPVVPSKNIPNYSPSYFHSDIGEIRVILERKINSSQKRESIIKFPIRLMMQTSSSETTTVLSCSSIVSADSFVNKSLSPNGYIEFPNGLKFQWGRFNVSPNRRTTIYFSKPFRGKPFSINVSGTKDFSNNATDNWPTLYNHPNATTKKSFEVQSSRNSAEPISWFAIGI